MTVRRSLPAVFLLAAALVGCKKTPPTPNAGGGGKDTPIAQLPLPPAGGGAAVAAGRPDAHADLYGDPGGEDTPDPDKAPVGAPLRCRKGDAFYRLGNPRFGQAGVGPFQNLLVDYERRRAGAAQSLVMIVKAADGRADQVILHGLQDRGTIAVRQGFGPWDQLPKDAELYLVNTDGRYDSRPQFKVSNSVNLGNVRGLTAARNWTAEEAAYLRNPPPPPKTYLIPNNDKNVGEDTQLVGEQTAPGPFRYLDADKYLLGFDYWMGSWDNGKKQTEASPSGFVAVFDRDQPVMPNHKRVAAKEGYAVGGVIVHSRVFVNAVKLICFKINPDGTLDPADKYESEWIGTPLDGGKPTTLGGDGRRVIGFHTRKGGVTNSIGLILERKK